MQKQVNEVPTVVLDGLKPSVSGGGQGEEAVPQDLGLDLLDLAGNQESLISFALG